MREYVWGIIADEREANNVEIQVFKAYMCYYFPISDANNLYGYNDKYTNNFTLIITDKVMSYR